MRAMTVLFLLVSMAAFAEDKRVRVPVGYRTTVDMPANVKKVTLSDPSIVDVRQRGRKLTFIGQKRGSSEAIVHTGEGKHRVAVRMAVYVASDRYALPY
jgi:Flp pilus assembly secretin CpaC